MVSSESPSAVHHDVPLWRRRIRQLARPAPAATALRPHPERIVCSPALLEHHLSILQHLSRAGDGVRRIASVDRGHSGVPPRMERWGRAAMVVRRRMDTMGAAAAVAGRRQAELSSVAVRR